MAASPPWVLPDRIDEGPGTFPPGLGGESWRRRKRAGMGPQEHTDLTVPGHWEGSLEDLQEAGKQGGNHLRVVPTSSTGIY